MNNTPKYRIQFKKFPVQMLLGTVLFLGLFVLCALMAILVPVRDMADGSQGGIILTAVMVGGCILSLVLLLRNLRFVSNYATSLTLAYDTVAIEFLDPLRDAMKGTAYQKHILSYELHDSKIKIYYHRQSSREILVIAHKKYLADGNDWPRLVNLVQQNRR